MHNKWFTNDAEVPVEMTELVSGPTPPGDDPPPPPGPATKFFTKRLEECYEKIPVPDPSTGRLVEMNTHKLSKFLDYTDDDDAKTPARTNTFYRIARGETSPRIDMVYAIAKTFGVPPSSFLPDHFMD
jgi:hypothetical protein